MNMQTFSKSLLTSLAMLICFLTNNAHAQIPVTDAAGITTSITNQVESITKWTQQFSQMQQQIQQYQQQIQKYQQTYNSITGSRGMGELLNNSALKAALPTDWQNVLTSVKTTTAFITERGKYPTLTNLPKANAMYDVIASQNAIMSDLYKKATGRITLIQSLTAQIDSANDPAAKQDLANRLINEQNDIQANQNLVVVLQSKQKQDLETASQAAIKEISCKDFKRATC